MKIEDFKKELEGKTDITYELVKERFNPEFSGYSSLYKLITNYKCTYNIIEDLCSWGGTPEGKSYWSEVRDSLLPPPTKEPPVNTKNPLNHVSYYGGDGPYEVLKIIEALGLGFHDGNVFKYIARAGKKDPSTEIEDLKKAEVYLRRLIEFKERENVSKG